MFGWLKRPAAVIVQQARRMGMLSRDEPLDTPERGQVAGLVADRLRANAVRAMADVRQGVAMDAACGTGIKAAYRLGASEMSETLLAWYFRQGFIGHNVCAFLLQHWLIDKACAMPARDAVRQGYEVKTTAPDDVSAQVVKAIKAADHRYRIVDHMIEFVARGRGFGLRPAMFKITPPNGMTEAAYYEAPFNPDGITPGSYRGIVQLDPMWLAPELDMVSAGDPTSLHFYEPTWWNVAGLRVHRSHLIIFRTGTVPDVLKSEYRYGGVPVPQRIMERVYCAERTANEAPLLAMTKRLNTFGTDIVTAMANSEKLQQNIADFVALRDNHGVKVYDKESEEVGQQDTSLADLDDVIMSQYQLVAAAANVPATKLLGTTPKGFNATGEYEEASYHEELESIQANDLSRLLARHHLCVMRSEIAPDILGGAVAAVSVVWAPLDSPTSKEAAEVQLILAQRDVAIADTGAIDGIDIRERLRTDEDSGYYGIEAAPVETPEAAPTLGLDSLQRVGGAWLVTNQTHLDPDIVEEKRAARDYRVQVSPPFPGDSGKLYRVVIDGHHSLAAAHADGVDPQFIEGDYASSDYKVVGVGP